MRLLTTSVNDTRRYATDWARGEVLKPLLSKGANLSLMAGHSNLIFDWSHQQYCMVVVLSMVRTFLKRVLALTMGALVVASLSACAAKPPIRKAPPHKAAGLASYYGKKFHGRRTASGERFNMHAMTAAHRSFKFGTRVKVTNLKNKRSVTVRINDRGPFARGRIIDLSYAAAKKIGMIADGVVRVKIAVVD